MRRTVIRRPAAVVAGVALTAAALVGCTRVAIPDVPIPGAPGSDGSVVGGAQLPQNWPSDVPVPSDVPLRSAVEINLPEGPSFTAVFGGPGDANAVNADLVKKFRDAGFTADASFGDGSVVGLSVWKKGDLTVQVMVAKEGSDVVVSESILVGKGR